MILNLLERDQTCLQDIFEITSNPSVPKKGYIEMTSLV
jgi:hypothetical protein